MREILNFDDLPSEYTSNCIGSGANGSAYKIDDKYVFKTFKNPTYFEANVKELFNVYLNSFVLPKKLVYVNGKFVGYIMEYINGNTLDRISGNTSISTYINSLKRLEYDLAALSTYNFFIIDFKDKNIMVNENDELKVIDTDLYTKIKTKDLYAYNLANLSYAVIKPFLNSFVDGIEDEKLDYKRRQLLEGRYLPSRFMENINSYSNNSNSNIREFKDQVKLLLK